MHSDELSALADALDRIARTHAMIAPDESETQHRAADYLRAQADAQPVAWMHIDGRVVPDATMDQAYRDGGAMQSSLRDYTIPLYTHPAPVVPHHAMLDSHRRLVEQAIQTAEHPSGMSTHDGKARIDASVLRRMLAIIDSLPAAPQAEPKREPLTYEQLVSACYTYRHDFGLLDPDEQHLVIEEAGRWAKAFGIGGSDAE